MANVTIPSFTIFTGLQVLEPLAVPAGWSHLELSLDIANLTSMDVLIEFSSDGVTWQMIVREQGLIAGTNPVTGLLAQYNLVANFKVRDTVKKKPVFALPAGQVRCTLNNAVAFVTQGGQLTVT